MVDESGDFALALVQYVIDKNLYLGTKSLHTFTTHFKGYSEVPKDKIKIISLSLLDFIQLRVALLDREAQVYLRSQGFAHLPRQDKLMALVDFIRGKGFVLRCKNLRIIYTGLPGNLADGVVKRDIQCVNLPRQTTSSPVSSARRSKITARELRTLLCDVLIDNKILADRLKQRAIVKALGLRAGLLDCYILREAAIYLINFKGRKVIAALRRGLVNTLDWSIRSASLSSLFKIQGKAAFSYLTKALQDEDWHVRTTAVQLLGEIGGLKAEKVLSEQLKKDPAYGCVGLVIKLTLDKIRLSRRLVGKIALEFAAQFDFKPGTKVLSIGTDRYNNPELALSLSGYDVTIVTLQVKRRSHRLDPLDARYQDRPIAQAIRGAGGNYRVISKLFSDETAREEFTAGKFKIVILSNILDTGLGARFEVNALVHVLGNNSHLIVVANKDGISVTKLVRQLRRRYIGLRVYEGKPYYDVKIHGRQYRSVTGAYWTAIHKVYYFRIRKKGDLRQGGTLDSSKRSSSPVALLSCNKFFPRQFNIFQDGIQETFSKIFSFMEGYYRRAAVWMPEINMTAFLADALKAKALQDTDDFSGFKWMQAGHQLTSISWRPTNSRGLIWGCSTSKQSWIASLILSSRVGIVLACVWQPFKAGTDAANRPSSSFSISTKNWFLRIYSVLLYIKDNLFELKSQGFLTPAAATHPVLGSLITTICSLSSSPVW